MYEIIKEQIKLDYYIQNFQNEGQRFVAWYLRTIHHRDMNEARDDITDGADDKQIDAVVVDNEKSTIYIIQGKFIGAPTVDAGPLREVLSSWLQLKDLVRLQEVANLKLKRKLSEVASALEDDYEVCFELITTSKLSESAQNDLATFQKNLADLSEKDDFIATLNIIDNEELKRRYDLALEAEHPIIDYSLTLDKGKCLSMSIAGTNVVIAAIPLKECIKIPGIRDGTLFKKNVRQSLGLSNSVNKGIKNTIYGDKYRDFFFFHNGITAICSNMTQENGNLKLHELNVVNGCQSLNTILSCSERVKSLDDTYILFRFYEIPQRPRADMISILTNSQSAVKARDLRSNDKRVLNLKKLFEQRYTNGYMTTKRGEELPADKDKNYSIDISDLGKYLISWQSQRPNIAYSESKIFDKFFDQLFKREYKPENIQALNFWMKEIMKYWTLDNPLGLNNTLLSMKAYVPFHQLYGISRCFAISNNQQDLVPSPYACFESAKTHKVIPDIIRITGMSLNMALEAASNSQQPQDRVFSPQNWIKAKSSLSGISFAIMNYFTMLPAMPGGVEMSKRIKEALLIPKESFEYRWAAD